MSLTFGSLFSGIGGIDLGFTRAGLVCKWQVERDDFCLKILAKHWPDVVKFDDVRTVGKSNLEPVDIICGGFPCQDISNAGNRVGIEGERSGLWAEMYRIVCELRPQFVIVENVAALLIRGFSRVLGDLAAIGYNAEWEVLSAAAFGFPHLRKRIFIIAYPCGSVEGIRWDRKLQKSPKVNWEGFLLNPGSRKADGIPGRMDRLRGLGNAVIPDIAEYLAECIVRTDNNVLHLTQKDGRENALLN